MWKNGHIYTHAGEREQGWTLVLKLKDARNIYLFLNFLPLNFWLWDSILSMWLKKKNSIVIILECPPYLDHRVLFQSQGFGRHPPSCTIQSLQACCFYAGSDLSLHPPCILIWHLAASWMRPENTRPLSCLPHRIAILEGSFPTLYGHPYSYSSPRHLVLICTSLNSLQI